MAIGRSAKDEECIGPLRWFVGRLQLRYGASGPASAIHRRFVARPFSVPSAVDWISFSWRDPTAV
jgi:hypothetical protein